VVDRVTRAIVQLKTRLIDIDLRSHLALPGRADQRRKSPARRQWPCCESKSRLEPGNRSGDLHAAL